MLGGESANMLNGGLSHRLVSAKGEVCVAPQNSWDAFLFVQHHITAILSPGNQLRPYTNIVLTPFFPLLSRLSFAFSLINAGNVASISEKSRARPMILRARRRSYFGE